MEFSTTYSKDFSHPEFFFFGTLVCAGGESIRVIFFVTRLFVSTCMALSTVIVSGIPRLLMVTTWSFTFMTA